MVRRVAVRTVANAQEASGTLNRQQFDPLTPVREAPAAWPSTIWEPKDVRSPTIQVRDQVIDPFGIPIMRQSDANPRFETVPNPDFDPNVANTPWPWAVGGSERAESNLAGLLGPLADQIQGMQQANIAGGDTAAQGVFDMLQVNLATAQATADSMIAFAVDAASQPYDEALRRIDRDIADTAGRMDDLDKITDYYKSKLVAPWARAAAEAQQVNSRDIAAQASGVVAAIGDQFDVANANVQAYLDRIGGVPVSQKMAITENVQALLSPYEGLVEAEAQGLGSIVEATGTLLEKQAARGLTSANLEAETNRFVMGSLLRDAVEDMNLERTDMLGDRARAIKRARDQAQQQYAVTGIMPPREDVIQMAATAALGATGLDPVQQQEWMESYYELRSSAGLFVGYDIVLDEAGEEVQIPMYLSATDPTQFEIQFANLPDHLQDPDLMDIMTPLLAATHRTGLMYDQKDAAARSAGGSTAPANYANRNQPNYVERANMVTNMRSVIQSKFPGLIWNGQWRDPSATGDDPRRHPNSDHLSGGAIDWNPAPGPEGEAEADAAAAWLRTLPNVAYVLWKEAGHFDHIHVSFRLPENVGEGAQISNFQESAYTATPVRSAEDMMAIDPGTQEIIRELMR